MYLGRFKYILVIWMLVIGIQNSYSQLSFCTGNSGEPIFTEDFGTGTNIGPALNSGVTTYSFTTGTPFDGSYTIANSTNYFDWHNTFDHTPNDVNGKALIVNASHTPDEFYNIQVDGLCENTSYEFSAWLLNLLPTWTTCPNGGLPINVNFQIWDNTDTNLLASGDTGSILGSDAPDWNRYGLVFTTLSGQSSVILKMTNNGVGGCGNDVAIDDIVFKSCGDFISLTDDIGENIIAQCEDEGVIVSTTITATPDFSIFNSHAYQWQESADAMTWIDIAGETSNVYTTPTLIDSRYFRVKVAEDPINVSNSLCNVVSEVFSALIVPIADAPISNGDLTVCADEPRALRVTTPSDQIVNWYDAPTGGNLLASNNNSYMPTASGTFYAAASSNLTECFSLTRTPLTYTLNELPVVNDENIVMCENVPLALYAGVTDVSYLWSTGETTGRIEINQPGTYTMTATNANGCHSVKTIQVEQIDQPIIETIQSENEDILISTTNTGDFEYALDEGPFQASPVFALRQGGLYTISVRGNNNCPAVSQEFLHFVIPKFFTPNGDSNNDLFELHGLENFSSAEVQIFDRYGALIKHSTGNSFFWDGTLNGNQLPSSDYWYNIKVDEQLFRGHFSLKR